MNKQPTSLSSASRPVTHHKISQFSTLHPLHPLRYRHCECAALAQLTLHPDVAAVAFDDVLHYGKAQPGAALFAWASLQPEKKRRRMLIGASLASRDMLMQDRPPDLREELDPIRDFYSATCDHACAEFRDIYRRLSLREPGRARACEEEFAGERPS